MDFDKNIDIIIAGKNIYSLFYAMSFQKQGKRVLLIDDETINLGPLYRQNFSLLERNFFESWASHLELEIEGSFDDYFNHSDVLITVDHRSIILGPSEKQNYLELKRKIPSLFDLIDSAQEKEFLDRPDDFSSYLRRLCDEAIIYQNNNVFKNLIPGDSFSSLLSSIAGRLKLNLEKDDNEEPMKAWRAVFNYFCHSKYGVELDSSSREHFLLNLISPHFKIAEAEFLEGLEVTFKHMGGALKKAAISNWDIDKGRVYGAELSTFDGLIQAPHSYLFGHYKKGGPFIIENHESSLTSISHRLSAQAGAIPIQRHIICLSDKMGGDFNLVEFQACQEGGLIATAYHPRQDWFPEKTLNQQCKKLCFELLATYYPELDLQQMDVERLDDDFMELLYKFPLGHSKGRDFERKVIKNLIDFSTPKAGAKVGHLNYLGPIEGYHLGKIGLLLKAKNISY